ncbi:MAG TPA: hypothetical protein DD435_03370 [Cyanobacteria bacterium UBA8530]|nr:hypothetical protein [Cyanobacteria bacterium UBA8530]
MAFLRKIGLRVRIVLVFQTTIAVMLALVCWFFYTQGSWIFREELRSSLKAQAATAALVIDGDLHQSVKNEKDPAYRIIHSQLRKLREVDPFVKGVYTIKPLYPRQNVWQFVVDAESPGGPLYAAPGRRYDATQDPVLGEGWHGPSASKALYSDEYGEWLSGYAPILNKSGKTVAILGLDVSAKNYLDYRAALARNALGIFLLSLLLSGLIVVSVTRRIADPLENERRLNRDRIEGLKQADRIKDDFLSVISHELRTPLNGIMGFGSILLDELQGLLNPPQRRSVEKILMSTDRMLELVDSLLDFTRLRAGLFSIFPKETPYPVLLREAIVSMRPLARAKGLEIECEVSVPGEVSLDRQRIFQVLANLIANAVKFTPPGGKVAIRAFIEENRLVTEVMDSGIGIEKEDLPRLFAPFQQLDAGLTRGVEGTGIGLSICKEILTLHGGFIEAESEGRDKGCTFRFVLPTVPKGESPT